MEKKVNYYSLNLARTGGRAVAGFRHFSRDMRTINQQIKEAESTFLLAGAGIQDEIPEADSCLQHAHLHVPS